MTTPSNARADALHQQRGFFPTERQQDVFLALSRAPSPGLTLLGVACPSLNGADPADSSAHVGAQRREIATTERGSHGVMPLANVSLRGNAGRARAGPR